MNCWECGAEFDELNESQPVCPACGAAPGGWDDDEVSALFEDAALLAGAPRGPVVGDRDLETDDPDARFEMPRDLREAQDDAEALLLATGHATFDLPEGFRVFRLPTDRVM